VVIRIAVGLQMVRKTSAAMATNDCVLNCQRKEIVMPIQKLVVKTDFAAYVLKTTVKSIKSAKMAARRTIDLQTVKPVVPKLVVK
jgi:hypothetical protein